MVFVYIENKKFLSKIITYLEKSQILFTTDFNVDYDTVLVAEINKRTLKLVENSYLLKKKIVFLSHLEEDKILYNYNLNNKQSIEYRSRLYNFLNMCDLIIVSLPYFKKILNKKIKRNIIVIEREVGIFNLKADSNIYTRFEMSKRKKKVLYIDNKYEFLSEFFQIALANPKIDFIMLGFIPDYYLSEHKKHLLMNVPSNVKSIKYYDENILIDLIKIMNTVIYTDKVVDINFIYKVLFLKKNLIVKENKIYDNYLIDNKNIYLFDKTNLVKKTCKLLNGDVANLTLDGYDVVKKNRFNNIVSKINNISL